MLGMSDSVSYHPKNRSVRKKIGSGKILVSGKKIGSKKKPDRSVFSELRSEQYSPKSGNKISAFMDVRTYDENSIIFPNGDSQDNKSQMADASKNVRNAS